MQQTAEREYSQVRAMHREHNQVAESLRQRMHEALAAYRHATDEYGRLMSTASERRSLQFRQHARLTFERALRDFDDFIRRWMAPPAGQAR